MCYNYNPSAHLVLFLPGIHTGHSGCRCLARDTEGIVPEFYMISVLLLECSPRASSSHLPPFWQLSPLARDPTPTRRTTSQLRNSLACLASCCWPRSFVPRSATASCTRQDAWKQQSTRIRNQTFTETQRGASLSATFGGWRTPSSEDKAPHRNTKHGTHTDSSPSHHQR